MEIVAVWLEGHPLPAYVPYMGEKAIAQAYLNGWRGSQIIQFWVRNSMRRLTGPEHPWPPTGQGSAQA